MISILAAEASLHENKKKSSEKCYPSGNRTWASHNIWFHIQHYPFWTKLTFACKTETLGSLYNHALLILTGSSKSKNQVVHGHNFKDFLSSTCQVSPERIVLDLESEVMRGPGSIPTGGNIFHSNTGQIQCEVLTTLPNLSFWIKKFLGQQSKIWDDNLVKKLFR